MRSHALDERSREVAVDRRANASSWYSSQPDEDAGCKTRVPSEPVADAGQKSLPRREHRASPRAISEGVHHKDPTHRTTP